MIPQELSIVCMARHSWESAWARPQQLMSRFARERIVLFIRPISVQHVITKKYERRRKVFKREGENLYIYSPVVLPWGRRFAPIRWLNEFIIRRLVRRKVRKLGIESFALWMYAPVSEYLCGRLGESMVVYDCTDAWSKFSNVPDYLARREGRLSRNSDVLFAGTGMLYDEKKKVNPNTHLFTCGVDYEHFRPNDRKGPDPPDALKDVPRPIIGYSGLIDKERLDIVLLDRMAREHPDWSIVLIGPVQDRECLRLEKLPNIYFTGLVSYKDLPDYVQNSDVVMIPYAINEGTRYINPTKLLEYMAAGKPVVSSDIPELRTDYADKILLAGDTEKFIEGVSAILEGRCKVPVKENMAHSSKFSWESMQEKMEQIMEAAV